MVKKKNIKSSLIPDKPTFDDGGTYEAAEIKPVAKLVEFYDPKLKPETDNNTILNIYDGPRYGGKTLKELKAWCKSLNIPTSGSKKKLIDRLDEENKRVKTELIAKRLENKKSLTETITQKVQLLERRKRRVERIRKQRLKTLIESQQAFDGIEKELNDIKVTLKSLESLF
tara:strand:+ start:473 stop:985 length:513 start_codon:yes stop_codon:yes gene_type:complete